MGECSICQQKVNPYKKHECIVYGLSDIQRVEIASELLEAKDTELTEAKRIIGELDNIARDTTYDEISCLKKMLNVIFSKEAKAFLEGKDNG